MEKVIEFLSNEQVLTILVQIIVGIYMLLKAKYFLFDGPKEKKLKKAIELGETAIQEFYYETVRAAKAAKADGKLTPEEIKDFQKQAIEKWKDKASDEGINIAKLVGSQYLPVLLDKIIGKLKGRKN